MTVDELLVFRVLGKSVCNKFSKNDHQDLKMGCIDACRRQLQSVLKIGVETDLFAEIMGILVLPDHISNFDCIFPRPGDNNYLKFCKSALEDPANKFRIIFKNYC